MLVQDYANHVADRLLVDYATVQRAVTMAKPEFGGQGRVDVQEPAQSASKTLQRDPASAAEREFVRLVCADVSLRADAQGVLDADLIRDGLLRQVLEYVVASGTAVGTDLYEAVASKDRDAAEALSGLILDGDPDVGSETIAADVLSKLKEFALERQIIERKARLRSLEEVKRSAEYDDLFKEIAALQVRLDRLRRGVSDDRVEDGNVG